MVVVRFEYHRLSTPHAPQHLDAGLPEVRRHRHRALSVGDTHAVGQRVVRNLEEGRRQAADVAFLSRGHRLRAEGLADAGRCEDRYAAVADHGAHAAGMVGVPVGQEYRSYILEVPADSGEEGFYAAA